MELLFAIALAGVAALGGLLVVPAASFIMRLAPYAYSNARVKSMPLLEKEEIIALAGAGLEEALEKAGTADPEQAEAAIDAGLEKAWAEVMESAPEGMKGFLKAWHMRYEIEELKETLRAAFAGEGTDKGLLERLIGEEASGLRTPEEIAEKLQGTGYGKHMKEALERFEEKGKIEALEKGLDLVFFERLIEKANGGMLREFAIMQADLANLRMIERLGKEAEGHLIPNADGLSREMLEGIMEDRGKKEETIYSGGLGGAEERLMDRIVAIQPMGAGAIMEYIYKKDKEAKWLKTIVKCKREGLEQAEIEALLGL